MTDSGFCIDLSGEWRVHDREYTIDTIVTLPGSSCGAHIGTKRELADGYSRAAVRAPLERYEYKGELIYEREVDIPEEFEGMSVSVFFERINISSHLFFDGIEAGHGITCLSTPHVYRLTDRLTGDGSPMITKVAGHHTLSLVISNTDVLHIGDMASGYSLDTQGYWNGCIGRMELTARPAYGIASAEVFPRGDRLDIETVAEAPMHACCAYTPAVLLFCVTDAAGQTVLEAEQQVELYSHRQRYHLTVDRPESLQLWNEFDPTMYTLTVRLCGGVSDRTLGDGAGAAGECAATVPGNEWDRFETQIGIRTLATDARSFMVNGRRVSLRGTINCAQYPLTGYPPMDVKTWEEHLTKYKAYGLNHVRFHAWCPPEAAFTAADRLGMYLAVEMPLWLNREVTPIEFGDDDRHTAFFRGEGRRIIAEYGHHPSFLCFSNGNENMGDMAMLEDNIRELRALDDRHFYTMTSNFDHPASPFEDYRIAFEIDHRKVRNQNIQDVVAESTCTDFEEVCAHAGAPVISFEVGQYAVFPDVDLCERYTGAMLPVNFDAIRQRMRDNGVYDMLPRYLEASGDIALKLYKEDIEAFMRTDGMGGIQLLSLVDYTGQSTATVGALNIFHESKPGMPQEEWSHFCGDVVPLFAARRIFMNTGRIEGDIMLYDHGSRPVARPEYHVRVMWDDRLIYEADVKGNGAPGSGCYAGSRTHVSIPLDMIDRDAMLTVYVTVTDAAGGAEDRMYTNSWRVFVFTEKDGRDIPAADVMAGGCGTVLATRDSFKDEELQPTGFIPVFWSPVHFATKAPCGAMIDAGHPALAGFPTDRFPDYQWKSLLDNAVTMDITGRADVVPIVEMVPNFDDARRRSPLCIIRGGAEAGRTGEQPGDVLFCGFDLDADTPEAGSLKRSLYGYVSGSNC